MNTTFLLITLLFALVAIAMILIILVQRPQGGGLAGAFGGAGGGSSETVFGGRVGDALTWATIVTFVLYLSIAIALNKIESGITSTEAAAGGSMTRIEGTQGEPPSVQPVITPTDPPPGVQVVPNPPAGNPDNSGSPE